MISEILMRHAIREDHALEESYIDETPDNT
jgi:hypothetical protein